MQIIFRIKMTVLIISCIILWQSCMNIVNYCEINCYYVNYCTKCNKWLIVIVDNNYTKINNRERWVGVEKFFKTEEKEACKYER